MKRMTGCTLNVVPLIVLLAGYQCCGSEGMEVGGRDQRPVSGPAYVPAPLGQLVEGFSDIAPVTPGISQRVNNGMPYFPRAKGADDTWGQLTAYWAIPGEEVTWLTDPCPRKKITTFAFAALLGRLNGYHELFVNGRYALTFTTAAMGLPPAPADEQAAPPTEKVPVSTRWENRPYQLRFYPGHPEPGLAGVFYLTVPARDIVAGKPVRLTVRPAVQDYREWTPYGKGEKDDLFIYWRGMPFLHGKGWKTLPQLRDGFEFYFALKNIPTAWAIPIGPPATGWFRAVTAETPRSKEELELLVDNKVQTVVETPNICLTQIEREPTWERATLQFPQRPGEMGWVGVKEFRGEFAILWNGLIGVPVTGGSFLPYDYGWTEEKPYNLEVVTGVGDPPTFFLDKVSRDFSHSQEKLRGYLPIITTKWAHDGLHFQQEGVATLLGAEEVRTGYEPMIGLFRYRVSNVSNPGLPTRNGSLWLSFNQLAYSLAPIPARVNSAPPAFKGGLTLKGNALLDDRGRIRATLEPGPGITMSYLREFPSSQAAGEEWASLKKRNLLENTVRFDMELAPGETLEILLKVPYFSLDPKDQQALDNLEFEPVLAKVADNWEQELALTGQLSVPDEFLNRAWKAEQCNSLIIIDKERTDAEALEKQGKYLFPLPPERANGRSLMKCSPGHYDHPHPVLIFAIHGFDLLGRHQLAERLLQPFIDWHGKQTLKGIVNWKGYTSTEGMWCAPVGEEGKSGYNYIPWGCQNGVVMWGMIEHYRLTDNRAWLEQILAKLIAGCDWIISQRKNTMKKDSQGRKVPHWGLLPKATWTDDPGGDHVLSFTDAFNYLGMKSVARALAELDHPEAERLQREAAAYREDILAALHWSVRHAPKFRLTGGREVSYIPASLYKLRPTLHPWHLVEVANLNLVKTGLLEAKDPLIGSILRIAEDVPCCMSFGISTSEPFYSPQIYAYFLRDELDHMWQSLYAIFARGFARTTLVGLEEQWGVWGLTMMPLLRDLRNTMIWEDGDILRLAQGVPTAWLADGRQFSLRKAATYFGPASLEVRSHLSEGRIEATIESPTRKSPKSITLRLRNPLDKPIKRVTVNGKNVLSFKGDTVTLVPQSDIMQVVVFY